MRHANNKSTKGLQKADIRPEIRDRRSKIDENRPVVLRAHPKATRSAKEEFVAVYEEVVSLRVVGTAGQIADGRFPNLERRARVRHPQNGVLGWLIRALLNDALAQMRASKVFTEGFCDAIRLDFGLDTTGFQDYRVRKNAARVKVSQGLPTYKKTQLYMAVYLTVAILALEPHVHEPEPVDGGAYPAALATLTAHGRRWAVPIALALAIGVFVANIWLGVRG